MATFRLRGNRWQVQVRGDGHRPATRTFTLKRDAEAWARRTEARLERDEEALSHRKPPSETLGDLVLRYRNTVSITKKGFPIEAAILDAFLREPMCSKRAYTLTSADFARYRDKRLTEVLPVTVRREFCILHNMFEVARREWALTLPLNPVSDIRVGPLSPARQRRLRPGEEQSLIAVASQVRNSHLRPAIELAIHTGLRRSELLALAWSDVDLEARYLRIPDSKNGHPRHVILTHRAVDVLRELPRTEGRVLPMSPNALRLAWDRIRRRAGCPDLHFHDLRHEAISRFFEMGLTTPEVASISGHRDIRMLMRYAHPMRQRIIEQMDKTGWSKTP